MLEKTKGIIKNRQSRETGTERRQTKTKNNTTQHNTENKKDEQHGPL